MNDSRLVIFYHLPKTAGTTIREILIRQYKDQLFSTNWYPGEHLQSQRPFGIYTGKVMPGNTWYPGLLSEIARRFDYFRQQSTAPIRAVYGFHCEYGLDEYLDQPSEAFTFLRDPVDRVLSHYYFTVDVPQDLDEAGLEEHLLSRIEGNLQTKMLSGPHGIGQLPADEEMLARAKANLKACAVVGLTSRFDETLMLLKRRFGWRWPLYARRHVNRKRPGKAALPAAILQRIAAENQLDAALYAYAKELFAGQVQAYGPGLAADLRWFRWMNSVWSGWDALGKTVRGALKSAWDKVGQFTPAKLRPQAKPFIQAGKLTVKASLGGLPVGEYDFVRARWQVRQPFVIFFAGQSPPMDCDALKTLSLEKLPSAIVLDTQAGYALLNRETRQHLKLDETELHLWHALPDSGKLAPIIDELAMRSGSDTQAVSQAVFSLVGKLCQTSFVRVQSAQSDQS